MKTLISTFYGITDQEAKTIETGENLVFLRHVGIEPHDFKTISLKIKMKFNGTEIVKLYTLTGQESYDVKNYYYHGGEVNVYFELFKKYVDFLEIESELINEYE